ncbi:MAG: xylulokinase, partial [Spirochaetia bacterium]|nr:xylulokinase [Spirochaetia bacterium]
MKTRLFLGVDLGTQSTKVVVYDLVKKKIVAVGHAPHALTSRADGSREQKAEWWIAALKKALSQVPAALKKNLLGMGVSGQQHGFVPVDSEGKVLHPVKLWCDTATAVECAEITTRFGGEDKLIREVGNPILPGYTASKILWFKKNHPELYAKLHRILLPHDYLNFFLTGEAVMEWGDASGTGLLDIAQRRWSPEALRALDPGRDLAKILPRLIQPHELAGKIHAKAAAFFALPVGLPVSAGGGDNMMGAIGTGTNRSGTLTLSLGTSGTLYGYSDKPMIDQNGILAAFCSSTGGWLPLLCTMNCTVATELTRGLLKIPLPEMEKLASKVPAGSQGVLTLPFFNGERTPNLPNGRGTITGLTPANFSKENLIRSAMESAVLGLRYGLESFTSLGFEPKEIKIIGGGAKSKLWRQMTADIFNLRVVSPVQEEAAAFGAALQAAWAVESSNGKVSDLNKILDAHIAFDKAKEARPNAKN